MIPLTRQVSFCGAWGGEPAKQMHFVMDTVNVFAAEAGKENGDPARAFLQCYARFPKMLHNIMLASVILLIHGVREVDFATVELYGAWFSTVSTLVGVYVLYQIMRIFASRTLALLCVPLIVLNTYVFLYANFPRQNMTGHAVTWAATLAYLRFRMRGPYLTPGAAVLCGLLYGVLVPIHYSGAYWFIFVVAAELALLVFDRKFGATLLGLLIMLASAALVWFVLDAYYFTYSTRYPGEMNWLGQLIAHWPFSFLGGMATSIDVVVNQKTAWKLDGPHWWFIFGFTYRSVGVVGSALISLGVIAMLVRAVRAMIGKQTRAKRAMLIMLTCGVVQVAISMGSMQFGRKLMPFYPFQSVALLFGLATISGGLLLLAKRAFPGWGVLGQAAEVHSLLPTAPVRNSNRAALLAAIIPVALIGLQLLLFAPELKTVFRCRRDAGYMRLELARRGIDRVLVLRKAFLSPVADTQVAIGGLSIDEADTFDYIMLETLFPHVAGENLREALRRIEPVVSYQNQLAIPLIWYEFPLKKSFVDFDDPLIHSRSLYRWEDVREVCLPYVGAEIDERGENRLPRSARE